MALARLQGIDPGHVGIFAGALARHPAAIQRDVVTDMESLGYGTLWCGEAIGREVFAQAAIVLAASSSLVVGSGIANIYARDPQATADGGRALTEAWPGRFILGLGVSHRPLVANRGHEYGAPLSTMRRYLQELEQAPWRGPEVQLPPIVLAALGPKMAALAAECTAGAYPYFTTTDHVAALRKQMGSEPFIAADLPVVLADNRAEARRVGDRHTSVYLRLDNYRNNLLRLGWPEEELEPPGSERLFDSVMAWGDLAAIHSRVEAHLAAGADQVVLNLIVDDNSRPYLDELRHLAPLTKVQTG